MASDVTMPRLSDSMEEGTVLKWLVEEGGEVKRGEPLVEIETDKANMTYDADTDGVLVEIVAQEGDTLEIGEVIARIGDAGEAKSDGGGKAEEGGEEEAAEDSGGGEEEGAEDSGGDEEEGAEDSGGGEEEAAADESEEEAAAGEEEGEEAAGDEEREEVAAEGEGAEDEAEADGGEEGDDDAAAAESGDEDEAAAEGEEAAVAGAEGGGGETQAGAGTATREKTSTGNGDGRVKASPVARRMARDLGVELAELEGTGPGGRIVKADVQAAAENGGGKAGVAEKGRAETADGDGAEAGGDTGRDGDGAEAGADTGRDADGAEAGADGGKDAEAAKKDKKGKKKDRKGDEKAAKKDEGDAEKAGEKAEAGVKGHVKVEELTRLQQTVSRRMAESKATAPDFSIALTVDMTAAVALRERLKEISDPVPSFNDMVVKACAGALREHPRVNGSYRDGKFELYDRINVGIAVAAMDALVVPTVFDADQKSLGQIARDAREVIGRVKDKTVTPPELSGGTFTVSNLGMFGIEQFTAIINPPQAAILTVGKLEKKPAVDDKGKLIARDQMVLTLVCDHRILYGADGAEFLARVKDLLEQPLSLAL
jgi:pyruvate dehydrogenase E2 component (dihydrolipoamide acetyltransferase)